MKILWAVSALVLAASAADAAVIRYAISGDVKLDYATRYYYDGFDTQEDVSDVYGSEWSVGASFDLDTSKFEGTSFSFFDLEYYGPFPEGISLPWAAILNSYSASFDENWNIISFSADLDDGGCCGSSISLGGASYYSILGPTGYYVSPKTGQLVYSVETYQYSGSDVTLTKTYLEGEPAPAPVPLPASALLMLSGLAGIGAIRARRR